MSKNELERNLELKLSLFDKIFIILSGENIYLGRHRNTRYYLAWCRRHGFYSSKMHKFWHGVKRGKNQYRMKLRCPSCHEEVLKKLAILAEDNN